MYQQLDNKLLVTISLRFYVVIINAVKNALNQHQIADSCNHKHS